MAKCCKPHISTTSHPAVKKEVAYEDCRPSGCQMADEAKETVQAWSLLRNQKLGEFAATRNTGKVI